MTQGFSPENLISQHEEFEIYDGYCKVLGRHVMVKYFTGESNGAVEAARRVASSMSHKNILRLIGYHESVNGTVLVHNSAAKGTLDQFLHGYGNGKKVSLTVQSRMNIAIEIGRVVRYMHEECPGGPVVHGDLQSHNVFLSHDFIPMLSGFEQAMWLQWVQVGTSCSYKSCCHKDPLNHESLELLKSDVFSFGVLLLKLFCKKFEPMDDKSLINWVRPMLQRGAFHELLEEDLENADPYEIYKVMAVVTKCTRTKSF
ncbi:hypothetical protein Syun_028762 [Stephania yunnanensis]|uniref:Protein kinase domain-containing protein n=1 Tax=Stephania yunnanensis TaxID=152371 RepID=A0AAP0HFG6_9MAGN